MKKNIKVLLQKLQKGNLRPRERVLLLVGNQINKEKYGKNILTKTDIKTIRNDWKPKNLKEMNEYNRFSEGWRTICYVELDARVTHLQSINTILMANNYISQIVLKKHCKNDMEDVAIKDKVSKLALLLKRNFAHDYAVLLAFDELFKRLSKTFENNLTYVTEGKIKNLRMNIEQLKSELELVKDDLRNDLTLSFDPDSIKPDNEALEVYYTIFVNLLGTDF